MEEMIIGIAMLQYEKDCVRRTRSHTLMKKHLMEESEHLKPQNITMKRHLQGESVTSKPQNNTKMNNHLQRESANSKPSNIITMNRYLREKSANSKPQNITIMNRRLQGNSAHSKPQNISHPYSDIFKQRVAKRQRNKTERKETMVYTFDSNNKLPIRACLSDSNTSPVTDTTHFFVFDVQATAIKHLYLDPTSKIFCCTKRTFPQPKYTLSTNPAAYFCNFSTSVQCVDMCISTSTDKKIKLEKSLCIINIKEKEMNVSTAKTGITEIQNNMRDKPIAVEQNNKKESSTSIVRINKEENFASSFKINGTENKIATIQPDEKQKCVQYTQSSPVDVKKDVAKNTNNRSSHFNCHDFKIIGKKTFASYSGPYVKMFTGSYSVFGVAKQTTKENDSFRAAAAKFAYCSLISGFREYFIPNNKMFDISKISLTFPSIDRKYSNSFSTTNDYCDYIKSKPKTQLTENQTSIVQEYNRDDCRLVCMTNNCDGSTTKMKRESAGHSKHASKTNRNSLSKNTNDDSTFFISNTEEVDSTTVDKKVFIEENEINTLLVFHRYH